MFKIGEEERILFNQNEAFTKNTLVWMSQWLFGWSLRQARLKYQAMEIKCSWPKFCFVLRDFMQNYCLCSLTRNVDRIAHKLSFPSKPNNSFARMLYAGSN